MISWPRFGDPVNFLNRALIDLAWDYNRDSFVDGTDLAVAHVNNTNFPTALNRGPAAFSRRKGWSSRRLHRW
jgi:hypothetical protein